MSDEDLTLRVKQLETALTELQDDVERLARRQPDFSMVRTAENEDEAKAILVEACDWYLAGLTNFSRWLHRQEALLVPSHFTELARRLSGAQVDLRRLKELAE